MAIRLLAIGDVHLGRIPGGLPDDLAGADLDPRRLGPATALERAVDEALAREVDAVLLAGDVVDQDNAFFEALEPLERAVERLAERGIPVLAVAGNHDARVLPRLVATVSGLRLLGADGGWEAVRIGPAHGPGLAIVGRSFPGQRSGPVMLDGLTAVVPGEGIPVVGLLHADLDAPPDSPYAPVSSADLGRAPVDLWLLGHVHRPSLVGPGKRPGYLGSLSPLDPGEPGRRGPWLVTWSHGRFAVEPLALAPLRFETVPIELATLEGDAPEDALLGALATHVEQLAGSDELETVRALGVRVRLCGRTGGSRDLERILQGLDVEQLRREIHGVTVFVERVSWELLPAFDLEQLARGDDPLAELARLATGATSGEMPAALLSAARERLERLASDARGHGLAVPIPDDHDLAHRLGEAARSLLLEFVGRAEDAT